MEIAPAQPRFWIKQGIACNNIREFYKSDRTVLTISIGQVHKPIYSSSIGKWKEYASLLEPFRKEMGDLIDEEGFLVGKR